MVNDHDITTRHRAHPAHPVLNTTAGHSGAGSSVSLAERPHGPRAVRRLLSGRKTGWIVTAVTAAVVVLSGCSTTSNSAATTSPPAGGSVSPSGVAGGSRAGGGSNARSGPAAGGAAGTVSNVSASSFTISTSAGQTVIVNETSSTTYQKGTSTAAASAITTGEPVLVLGTTSGTTVTATQVTAQPTGVGASATASSAQVVPFQRGAQSTAKQVGQIPSYTEGQGTIVSGTAANKATVAALAAYPGGVVDRVVQLSGGEYEVHYIGVNWPHHIFVNQNFNVVGAN
jgi:hypothetical protein